jgi:prophage regulatory protein
MDDRLLLSREDLKALGIPYSKSQLYRRMKEGSFPRAVKLGGSRIAWRRDDVIEWIDSLKSAADGFVQAEKYLIEQCQRIDAGDSHEVAASAIDAVATSTDCMAKEGTTGG